MSYKMKDKFNNYFLNITEEDEAQHKALVRKVRQNTNSMLKREAKKLFEKGFG